MRIDQPAFDASTFSKNRQRLLGAAVADEFFAAVVRQAKLRRYLSSDHFSVDGSLWRRARHTRASNPKPAQDHPLALIADRALVAVKHGLHGKARPVARGATTGSAPSGIAAVT